MSSFNLDHLFELIEQSGKLLVEKDTKALSVKSDSKTISFPRIRLSEKWGEPGSDDRKLIDQFVRALPGTSLQQKINAMQSFVNDCREKCVDEKDVAEILANLVFLDALASVIHDFSATVAGTLFESFLAALLGWKQSDVRVGRSAPIEDIVNLQGDKATSLKLVRKNFNHFGGSVAGLLNALETYGSNLEYIVVLKDAESELKLKFYSMSGEQVWDLYEEGWPSKQWKVTRRELEIYGTVVAELDVGDKKSITTVASRYVDRLGESLVSTFSLLDSLSQNINSYFIGDDKAAGLRARSDAEQLKINVDKSIA